MYEPPMADRLETQLALLMQMLSGFMSKESGKIEDFMICPKKRPKVDKASKNNSLLMKVKALFGVSNE